MSMPQQSASQMCNKPLDKSSEIVYNNTVRVDKGMKYIIYDNTQQQVGEFLSIYDLELFVDGIREGRGERYPVTQRMSPFDYLKSIGWYMTINEEILTE
jgi:hypothetical protein|tara:strand:- start:186 stop:482 length:297 start_codon:yes stop_codon:yes gene_type:complete